MSRFCFFLCYFTLVYHEYIAILVRYSYATQLRQCIYRKYVCMLSWRTIDELFTLAASMCRPLNLPMQMKTKIV